MLMIFYLFFSIYIKISTLKHIYNECSTCSKNKEPAKPIGTENKLYNVLLKLTISKYISK